MEQERFGALHPAADSCQCLADVMERSVRVGEAANSQQRAIKIISLKAKIRKLSA